MNHGIAHFCVPSVFLVLGTLIILGIFQVLFDAYGHTTILELEVCLSDLLVYRAPKEKCMSDRESQ